MPLSVFVCVRSFRNTARSVFVNGAYRSYCRGLAACFSTTSRPSCRTGSAHCRPLHHQSSAMSSSPEYSRFETGSTTLLRSRTYSTASEIVRNTSTSGFDLVYTAPLAGAVKSVKAFSLATALLAAAGAPLLVFFGNPSMSLIGRVAMTSFVTILGVSTTLILHWFIKTYVTKLRYNKLTKMVSVETYSMFLRKHVTEFHISQAGPPSSVTSFSTFQANGVGYFLHSEVFEDRELLSELVGSFSILENKAHDQ